MADELMTMSKGELRESLARELQRNRAKALRARLLADDAAEATGFALGTLAYGYLEGRGTIPEEIAGMQPDLVIGGALFVLSRGKRGRNASMMRGAGYGLLAGALRDIGKNFGSNGG